MSSARYILAILVMGLSAGDAFADGGIVRIREIQGPFVVTIFTAADPQENNPVDVSVLVQERESSDAILDAKVNLTFAPPPVPTTGPNDQVCGAGKGTSHEAFSVEATRQLASNKLLYAAAVKLDAAGPWQLSALIERQGATAKISSQLPVGPPRRKLIELFPYLMVPPLLVGLFALNQWLRRQSFGRPCSALVERTQS